jgi:hypothetical protein
MQTAPSRKKYHKIQSQSIDIMRFEFFCDALEKHKIDWVDDFDQIIEVIIYKFVTQ